MDEGGRSKKMSEIVEAIKALISPCEKLISVTQAAIGKAYEPRYVKRMADAKAYEIRQISQAIAESSDVPITYDKGDLAMDTKDFDELVKRTQNRLAYQELRKQANIEAVVGNAYLDLENEPPVTDEPIDPDWLIRFFNSVEDISNEQMQYLWGKILAGEIKQPNTFSMRTLNVLKNLAQSEAELFNRIAPYIFSCPGDDEKTFVDLFIPVPNVYSLEKNTLEKYVIPYSEIVILCEAGIIHNNPTISITLHLEPNETDWIEGTQGRIECFNVSKKAVKLYHTAYILTESGKELYSLIYSKNGNLPPTGYISAFMDSFIDMNSLETNKDIKVSIIEN